MVQVRGYLFTALTALMFMTIFMLAYYFYAKSFAASAADIGPYKTSALFDDVSFDIEEILELGVSVGRSGNTTYKFNDRIPARFDIPSAAGNYAVFINGTYAKEVNARLSLDVGAVSSNTDAVDLTIHPFRYSYGWGNLSKRRLWVHNNTLEDNPLAYNLTLDFTGEAINDLVWLEAENFTAQDGVSADDGDASAGVYMVDFTLLNTTVEIPLAANYTLWVRAKYDNTDKNFTVEVAGRNSTRFDLRDDDALSPSYGWFNDTAVTFELNPGYGDIRVYPGPSSGTESVDVVMLSTKPQEPDNNPPITRPNDQTDVYHSLKGNMTVELTVLFSNHNYTYKTYGLDRTALSYWNFTFDDKDGVNAMFGAVAAESPSYSSMLVELYDGENGSFGYANTTVTFNHTQNRAYVDSGCTLNKTDRIARYDRLWLAKG